MQPNDLSKFHSKRSLFSLDYTIKRDLQKTIQAIFDASPNRMWCIPDNFSMPLQNEWQYSPQFIDQRSKSKMIRFQETSFNLEFNRLVTLYAGR